MVSVVLDNIAANVDRVEILASYATLKPTDIDAALAYYCGLDGKVSNEKLLIVRSCEKIKIRRRNRLRHQCKLFAVNGGAGGFACLGRLRPIFTQLLTGVPPVAAAWVMG